MMNSPACIAIRLRGILVCISLCFPMVLAGCDESGSKRYDVSGTVTFEGKPVPLGAIVFEPDTSKGSSGPAGAADIKDGKYDTSLEGGKGVVGGPHVVSITAHVDESIPYAERGKDAQLFDDYRTNVDFPTEDTTHDFDVRAADVAGGAPY